MSCTQMCLAGTQTYKLQKNSCSDETFVRGRDITDCQWSPQSHLPISINTTHNKCLQKPPNQTKPSGTVSDIFDSHVLRPCSNLFIWVQGYGVHVNGRLFFTFNDNASKSNQPLPPLHKHKCLLTTDFNRERSVMQSYHSDWLIALCCLWWSVPEPDLYVAALQRWWFTCVRGLNGVHLAIDTPPPGIIVSRLLGLAPPVHCSQQSKRGKALSVTVQTHSRYVIMCRSRLADSRVIKCPLRLARAGVSQEILITRG